MSSCKHALDTRASRTQFDTRITAATACMWFLYSLVASKDKASCFGTAAVRLRPLLLLALRGTRISAAHPWLRRHLHGRSVLSEALLLAQEVQPQLLELGLQDPRTLSASMQVIRRGCNEREFCENEDMCLAYPACWRKAVAA